MEAVRKQLSCGVDPNVKDFAGWTPLVSRHCMGALMSEG